MTALLDRPVETPTGLLPVKRITPALVLSYDLLYSKEDFTQMYPTGWVPSARNGGKVNSRYDLGTMARKLLTTEGYEKYTDQVRTFREEYGNADNEAWRKWDRGVDAQGKRVPYEERGKLHGQETKANLQRFNRRVGLAFYRALQQYSILLPADNPATQVEPTAFELETPTFVPLRKITMDVIEYKGACSERYDFGRMFPNGVVPTDDLAEKVARNLNIHWAAGLLLSPKGNQLWTPRANELSEARHEAVRAASRGWDRRYNEDGARAEYQHEVDEADKVYHQALGKLFIRLFRKYPTMVSRSMASPEDFEALAATKSRSKKS